MKELTYNQLVEAGWMWDFWAYLNKGRQSCSCCHALRQVRFFYYHHTYPEPAKEHTIVCWCGECEVDYGKLIQELSDKDVFTLRLLNDLR